MTMATTGVAPVQLGSWCVMEDTQVMVDMAGKEGGGGRAVCVRACVRACTCVCVCVCVRVIAPPTLTDGREDQEL